MEKIAIVTGTELTQKDKDELLALLSAEGIPEASVLFGDPSTARLDLMDEYRLIIDRSGSIPQDYILEMKDEVDRLMAMPVLLDDCEVPGKSPEKLRRRQKDWELSSGKGWRR